MSIEILENLSARAIPLYDNLFRELWIYFSKYGRSYGDNDLRCNLFGNYTSAALWTIAQLEIFTNFTTHSIIKNRFDKLSPSSFAQIMLQYDNINRKTFLVDIMSSTEHFIDGLSQVICKKHYNTYKDNIDAIVVELFNGDQVKVNELYALYLVRNTLHNNGFIKRKIKEFDLTLINDLTLEKKTFSFRNNSKITLSGWDNLYLLAKRLFETIVQIIETQKITNLPLIQHNSELESDTGVLYNNLIK